MAKKPQKAAKKRVVKERFLKPGQRISQKRKEKAAAGNTMPPKPADPITVELPYVVADRIATQAALKPKAPISLSMRELLYGQPQLLIVKAEKESITNREEFVKEMAELNYKVVFLEHSRNSISQPTIERHERPNQEQF